MKAFVKKVFEGFTHIVGRVSGAYYFEDYVRVYPDGLAFNQLGRKRDSTANDHNNFLNHCKFYRFCFFFIRILGNNRWFFVL